VAAGECVVKGCGQRGTEEFGKAKLPMCGECFARASAIRDGRPPPARQSPWKGRAKTQQHILET
jgi:hypothetical protein